MGLAADEQVVWSRWANHSVGARAVGGKLLLTDRRLYFRPHFFERRFFAGPEWDVPRSDLAGFEVEGATGGLFSGGLRSRLRVKLADGSAELFVVWSPDKAARKLSEKVV